MFDCEEQIKKTLSLEERKAINVVVKAARYDSDWTVFSTGGPEDEAVRLRLPASNTGIAELTEVATPSYHGAGQKTVLDPSYRRAKELKAPAYALNFDPLIEILPDIQDLYFDEDEYLEAKMYKLNVYSEGGFFKPHRDTSKGRGHVGSLVVCLPSEFQGGELVVKQGNRVEKFSWSKCCAGGRIGWCFLYSDCEHEVLPVTAGTRLTLAYDVYRRWTTPYVQKDTDLPETQVYQKLAALSKVPAVYVKTLAYGMKHEYPTHHGGSIEKDDLKGMDRLIYRCAGLLGLQAELQGLVENDGRGYSRTHPDYDQKPGWILSDRRDYHMDSFQDECDDWHAEYEVPRNDRIWISDTGRGFDGGTYANYGNEVSLSSVYVSGVILIKIPSERDKAKSKIALTVFAAMPFDLSEETSSKHQSHHSSGIRHQT